MKAEDLDSVYEIELGSFSDPWLKEFFTLGLNHDIYVVEQDDEIAGFVCAMQVLDECTINNIAVKDCFRRQGIAEYMLKSLFDVMDKREVRFYYLEVRASNQAAYALYQKLGFGQIGIRKEYYHNPVEDAIVMSLDTKRG
jgi:ribosomal-protein-alanine N-acetyltransferase